MPRTFRWAVDGMTAPEFKAIGDRVERILPEVTQSRTTDFPGLSPRPSCDESDSACLTSSELKSSS